MIRAEGLGASRINRIRLRVLPDWVHEGVIVSLQGGTDAVRAKLDALNAANIPVAGLWIQDWPGVRVTSAGKQLWWDWKLDEAFYPGWTKLVADLERQGGRMVLYINPFLSIENGHDALFTQGRQKGYLVQTSDGAPYLIRNTNFSAALVDLTNPLAHMERFGKVYKGLAPCRKQLVAQAAARGYPVVRHLFLHYPDDANTFGLRYQFLLGPDLMVAPVLDKGADTVEVYFPVGTDWVDLCTGADAGRQGEWASCARAAVAAGGVSAQGRCDRGNHSRGIERRGRPRRLKRIVSAYPSSWAPTTFNSASPCGSRRTWAATPRA